MHNIIGKLKMYFCQTANKSILSSLQGTQQLSWNLKGIAILSGLKLTYHWEGKRVENPS